LILTTDREAEDSSMASHQLGTREEWAVTYAELRAEEKNLTRRNAALAAKRQALPWVPVEKEYRFETTEGTKTLAELFGGRSQLIVRHFMHGPKTPEGCPGCTFETDNLVGAVVHLAHRDVTFILAARSPLEVLNAYKARMGWEIEWVPPRTPSIRISTRSCTCQRRAGRATCST
jgi:predicted dithiol-disulfide oxidoreductase (DUF899 family)